VKLKLTLPLISSIAQRHSGATVADRQCRLHQQSTIRHCLSRSTCNRRRNTGGNVADVEFVSCGTGTSLERKTSSPPTLLHGVSRPLHSVAYFFLLFIVVTSFRKFSHETCLPKFPKVGTSEDLVHDDVKENIGQRNKTC